MYDVFKTQKHYGDWRHEFWRNRIAQYADTDKGDTLTPLHAHLCR